MKNIQPLIDKIPIGSHYKINAKGNLHVKFNTEQETISYMNFIEYKPFRFQGSLEDKEILVYTKLENLPQTSENIKLKQTILALCKEIQSLKSQ